MYYAWLEANEPDVAVGESIALHVEVRGTGYTDYASSEIVISYDNAVLTFDEFGSNLYGATIVNNDGTLTLEDFGESQSFGTGYVISFNANAEGEGTVTLTSAAFSTQANAANSDLISAVLQDTTVTIVATMYHSVDLPNIFIGADSVSSGEDYTFAPADRENYDYSDVTATMDGEPVEVTKNGDGSYTVENVTGDLVIIGSRSAKKYVVTITGITASNDGTLATYGMDYKFSLPENVAAGLENGKIYTLASITIGGKNYTNYIVDGRNYTILGGDINGGVVITITETSLSPTQYTVSVTGEGAGAAVGYEAVAEANKPYTLTIVPVAGYDNIVTATMGGERIELTVSENSYTTPNVTGDLVFTIDKVCNTEGVEIGEYLKLDETIVWLVTMEVVKLDDQVYTYDGNAMLWSEKYGAYCYLVISVEKPEIDADDFAIITGTAENVDYGMDVNKSEKVDANDAQLTYNMYNAMYSAFSDEVTIEKFLRADVIGDRTVNVQDARMIIDEILR